MIQKYDRLYQVNMMHTKKKKDINKFMNGNGYWQTHPISFTILDNLKQLYQYSNMFRIVELK